MLFLSPNTVCNTINGAGVALGTVVANAVARVTNITLSNDLTKLPVVVTVYANEEFANATNNVGIISRVQGSVAVTANLAVALGEALIASPANANTIIAHMTLLP